MIKSTLKNRISIIVSIYNNLDNLELILLALEKQTVKCFEVIVSEDNNSQKTVDFITNARKRFSYLIKHISQEDKGFRKTMALNKSVMASDCDYLIFLDGDCVPHRRLVESYLTYLTPTTICIARRCYIDKSLTLRLYETKNLQLLSVFNILIHAKRLGHAFYRSPKVLKPKLFKRTMRAIIGCNWGTYKQNILDVNGYDEDFVLAGEGEDFDIEWRLRCLNKFSFLNIKHQAITYHLYHEANYSHGDIAASSKVSAMKREAGVSFCKNGIGKYKIV
ncbi:MAG: glycosyltransferase [Tannerellaceae bacterium]|nr:glycosyltransferase [Tannerellaceae bacterium]